ncbi:hypothetical protein ACIQ1D_18700 [Lysinibacillus xylanilyticus]|uniref:Uncharacterized protein n=1 Tax=Lysinibacillus xylanilyticus TaxID=582475 RepID=A0A2M9QAA2_9BACI|nr:hypothetical protein [Lysinibacillus xylanilyticus]PJO44952.1 hypothetical protein CWD94_04510 [Lysinibacillus xylanilyticus]
MEENKTFKVVGVQMIPKNRLGIMPIVQQIADKEIQHSYGLIEKLVRPVNKDFEEQLRYEDSKSKSTRKFMVIGLMDMQSRGDVTGKIVFNPSTCFSMNIMNELQSLVRTIH